MRRFLTVIAVSLAATLMAGEAFAEDYVFEGRLEKGDQKMAGLVPAYKDLYHFNIDEGGEIRLFIEMENMQPHLAILDETGKLVDRTISVLDYSTQWDWKAPKAGTYQILVTTTYQADQAYRLTLSDLPMGTVEEYTRQP